MKKLGAITVLAILVVLLPASLASADQPPGVTRAQVYVTPYECGAGFWHEDGTVSEYRGPAATWVFSGSANGNTLIRCHATLVSGPLYWTEFNGSPSWPTCTSWLVVSGKELNITEHCTDLWQHP